MVWESSPPLPLLSLLLFCPPHIFIFFLHQTCVLRISDRTKRILFLFCFVFVCFILSVWYIIYSSVSLFPSVIFLFLVCYIFFLLFIFLSVRVFQSLLIVLETSQREITRLTAQLSLTDRFICFVCVNFVLGRIP